MSAYLSVIEFSINKYLNQKKKYFEELRLNLRIKIKKNFSLVNFFF